MATAISSSGDDTAGGGLFRSSLRSNVHEERPFDIEIDLIEEFHCWLSQVGSEPWKEELIVRE